MDEDQKYGRNVERDPLVVCDVGGRAMPRPFFIHAPAFHTFSCVGTYTRDFIVVSCFESCPGSQWYQGKMHASQRAQRLRMLLRVLGTTASKSTKKREGFDIVRIKALLSFQRQVTVDFAVCLTAGNTRLSVIVDSLEVFDNRFQGEEDDVCWPHTIEI